MNKKVLIIGSQGYLGSRLSQYLKEFDFQCTAVDTGYFKQGLITLQDSIPTVKKDARLIVESDIHDNDVILLAGIQTTHLVICPLIRFTIQLEIMRYILQVCVRNLAYNLYIPQVAQCMEQQLIVFV